MFKHSVTNGFATPLPQKINPSYTFPGMNRPRGVMGRETAGRCCFGGRPWVVSSPGGVGIFSSESQVAAPLLHEWPRSGR